MGVFFLASLVRTNNGGKNKMHPLREETNNIGTNAGAVRELKEKVIVQINYTVID